MVENAMNHGSFQIGHDALNSLPLSGPWLARALRYFADGKEDQGGCRPSSTSGSPLPLDKWIRLGHFSLLHRNLHPTGWR